LSVPPCLLLASLFEAYKFVFEDKTEHCILYYLFHNDLVNTAYSSKALLKVVIPLLVQQHEDLEQEEDTETIFNVPDGRDSKMYPPARLF
jgi:hypothetical protein